MTDWTKGEDDVLRAKWGKREARDIGREIGRSKSAVIGRAHRIGLDPVRRTPKNPREPRVKLFTRAAMKAMPKARSIVPESLFAPASLAVGILDLGDDQCSYIEGDDYLCCGHPAVSGARWCAFHYRVVYRVIDERQRAMSGLAAAE